MNEESIKVLEDFFVNHKQDFLRVIFASQLSKTKKLMLIQKHQLLPIGNYAQSVFKNQTSEIGGGVEDYWVINGTERYQTILFGDTIKYLPEIMEEDDLIIVARNRRTKETISITEEAFIDIIYDFVVEKQIIGFKMDW